MTTQSSPDSGVAGTTVTIDLSALATFQRNALRSRAQDRLRNKEILWASRISDRAYTVPVARRKIYRDELRAFGLALAGAVRDKDVSAFVSAINDAPRRVRDRVPHGRLRDIANNCDIDLDDYTFCDDCDTLTDDTSHTANNTDVCENCRGNYVYSDCMDTWISDGDTCTYYRNQRVYENGSGDYCTDNWGRRNAEWSDRASAYISDSVYVDGDDDEGDGDYESDSAPSNDGLTSYHGSYREFKVRSAKPDALYPRMPPLGVELEVYNVNRYNIVNELRNDFEATGTLLLETDGSLDSRYGFEIITDPLGYPEWQAMGPKLCHFLLAYGTKGYNTDGNYGIHITLHREFLSPLQEARLMMFTTAYENQPFMRMIAQRKQIYAASSGVDMGGLYKPDQRIPMLGGLRASTKKITGRGKYCPINFKPDLAEIRIFQSTLNPNSFMKNLEWVWAMVEWVRDSSGSSWQHQDFVKWLGQRGNARTDYKHLYHYLQRPTYGVRHLDLEIRNTWAHLLHTPNPVKGTPVVALTCADDALIAA